MVQKQGDMRELVAEVAGPRGWDDTRDTWLNRAAERAGITYRMVRAIFYGKVTNENHYAIQLLRLAAGRKAATDLAEQYETVAAGLAAVDPDFHRPHIAGLVHAARALRGVDRA